MYKYIYIRRASNREFCKTFFEQFSKQLAEVLKSKMWSELKPEFQKNLADSVQENLGLHGYPAASNKQINKRIKVTATI